MSINLWWIRRDLRLRDNPALTAALADGAGVIPVFVLDPRLLGGPAEKRRGFLFAGLRALDEDLRSRGSRLVVRQGEPLQVLGTLRGETGAEAVYAEADFSPYASRRDTAVAVALPLRLQAGLTVHPPQAVLKRDGSPYTVFTPFSRAWKALPPPGPEDVLPAPRRLPSVPAAVDSPPLPSDAAPLDFPAGELEAHGRLQVFTRSVHAPIYAYAEGRDRLDLEGTAGLSPYLRFGMLSARSALTAARQALEAARDPTQRKGVEAWINELIWREFYIGILHHFPFVLRQAFRPGLRDIAWRNDPDEYRAWCEGRTGYPVVDAAMRQLAQTGWMHNRARMITASFLVKDLLVDWRWGERWFMQHLVDGDPAANNGGWQWTAGVGTDAAPYFRIFSPALQSAKFDPQGAYIRRWVPELARVPERWIHTPWEMGAEAQRAAGCRIGGDYPAPIVDHALARERTLAAYKALE